MSDRIQKALLFAQQAHGAQLRKYTHTPYIIHPINVAHLVTAYGGTENMVIAALLHDVVEDTPVTLEAIRQEFGPEVAFFVKGLTDTSVLLGLPPGRVPRHVRKKVDRDSLAECWPEVQTIKLADLIDNSMSILAFDPGFAKTYMEEKQELLKVLTKGDIALHALARKIVNNYFRN